MNNVTPNPANNEVPSQYPRDDKLREDKMTWETLKQLEPALGELTETIQGIHESSEPFCANNEWFDWLLPQMEDFVRWDARRPNSLLRTPAAYRLAYQKLYDMLPDCRGSACIALLESVLENGQSND